MEYYGTEYDIEEDDELERLIFEDNGYRKILNEKLPVTDNEPKQDERKHIEKSLEKTKKCLKFLYMRIANEDLSIEEIGELNKSIKIYEEDLSKWQKKLEEE